MVTAIKDILNDPDKLYEVTKIAFDCVDSDKSGQIDENELEKLLSQISSDMGADEVLKYLDTDNSGKIEFKEFEVLIKDVLESMIQSDEG